MNNKKIICIISLLLLFAWGIPLIPRPPQTAGENGKTIILTEMLRIQDDEDENYYFKYPTQLKVGGDGCIYVLDQYQFLKFTPSGDFAGNFWVRGQGPGEVVFLTSYLLEEDRLILHDNGQNKVVEMDLGGNLLREFKYLPRARKKLIFFHNDQYYFTEKNPPETKGKLEIFHIDFQLVSMRWGGDDTTGNIKFPIKYMILRSGENFFMVPWAKLLIQPIDKNRFLFSHSPKYQIKLFDVEQNKVVMTISRPYQRVKVTKETKFYAHGGNYGKVSIGGQFHTVPNAEYHDDIQSFFLFKNRIWVVTSTTDKTRGTLIDLYNMDGTYAGHVYIKTPDFVHPLRVSAWIRAAKDDCFYAAEMIDTDWSLVKYKVEFQ